MFTAVKHMNICPLTRLYINNTDEIHQYEYMSVAAVTACGSSAELNGYLNHSESKILFKYPTNDKHRKKFHII